MATGAVAAILIPLSITTTAATAGPIEQSKLAVDSQTHPANSVGPNTEAQTFSVSGPKSAKTLLVRLDGHDAQERAFVERQAEATTEASTNAQPGWHTLELIARDTSGSTVGTYHQEFGVARQPQLKTMNAERRQLNPSIFGRFTTNKTRSTQPGIPVILYADPVAGGDSVLLGTTKTDHAGMWSFTFDNIPAEARKIAAGNNDMMQVRAIADASFELEGKILPAVGVIATNVVIGDKAEPAMTRAANLAPVAESMIVPIQDSTTATRPTEAQIEAGAPARIARESLNGKVSREPAKPNVAISSTAPELTAVDPFVFGGKDYSAAKLVPAAEASTRPHARAPGDDPGCSHENKGTVDINKRVSTYPVVIEGHASNQSFSSVNYTERAGTGLTYGFSVDLGRTWTVKGTTSATNNFGQRTGWDNKRWSNFHHVAMRTNYEVYGMCKFNDKGQLKKRVIGHGIATREAGALNGNEPAKIGANIGASDSVYDLSNAPFYMPIYDGGSFGCERNNTWQYTGSASYAGFSIDAQTTRSTDRSQTAYDMTGGKRMIVYSKQDLTECKAYSFNVFNTYSTSAPWQP